jgi:hypothetical protein
MIQAVGHEQTLEFVESFLCYLIRYKKVVTIPFGFFSAQRMAIGFAIPKICNF